MNQATEAYCKYLIKDKNYDTIKYNIRCGCLAAIFVYIASMFVFAYHVLSQNLHYSAEFPFSVGMLVVLGTLLTIPSIMWLLTIANAEIKISLDYLVYAVLSLMSLCISFIVSIFDIAYYFSNYDLYLNTIRTLHSTVYVGVDISSITIWYYECLFSFVSYIPLVVIFYVLFDIMLYIIREDGKHEQH